MFAQAAPDVVLTFNRRRSACRSSVSPGLGGNAAQFLSDGHITVLVRVNPARREDLLNTAVAVRAEKPDADGGLRLEVTFQDSRHTEWALWQLATDAEALAPQSLRTSLRNRAATIATRYGVSS